METPSSFNPLQPIRDAFRKEEFILEELYSSVLSQFKNITTLET